MATTSRRMWWWASLGLVVVAIAAEFVSKHFALLAIGALARAQARGTAEVRQVGLLLARRSDLWAELGLVVALLAVAAWLISRRAGEPGPRVVPVILMAAYLLLFLVMV